MHALGCTPIRCTPGIHIYKMHAYKVYAYKIHAYKMYTCKGCTPMRCTYESSRQCIYLESGLIFTPPKISHAGRHCVGWHAVVCYGAPEWFREKFWEGGHRSKRHSKCG